VSIQVLIGLKRLALVKQRLMPQLSLADRRTMMLAMLSTVAGAARASGLGPVALATSEPAAAMIARALGVAVVSDGDLPWNEGLAHARDTAGATTAVLYLAGDLPLLSAQDLVAFAAAAPRRGVVVARARDGGSNALLVAPADALTPRFGQPRSSEAHRAAAEKVGLACRVLDIAGLALDVDTIEDAWDAGLLAPFTGTGPVTGRG
jgi:2-phospho-L-lactate guanylyltransferase